MFLTPSPIIRSRLIKNVARFNRYSEGSLLVEMRTFGSPEASVCRVINSSLTGILICPVNRALPFQEKTLIESTIHASQNAEIVHNITFVGKVVRKENPKQEDDLPKFGIHIIEMEESDLEYWKKHISELGRMHGEQVSL